jgi:ABC-2 type transport system permease protein
VLLALSGTRSAATFIDSNSLAAMPQSLISIFGDLGGMSPVDQYLTVAIGKGTILIPVLYAVIVALSIVTREVDRRTVEFLLALPVQRTQVLLARVAVMAVNVTVVIAGIWAVLRFDMPAQGYEGSWAHLDVLFINIWLLAFALGSLTLAASMWVDDYSVGVKLFLGIVVLGYFMEYVLRAATVSRAGRVISPFSYVDISGVMRTGSISAGNAVVLAVAIVAGLAGSFWAFNRKQFSA